MTAALEGGEWSAARPGRTLPPGTTRYPFYRRLGGPQGWSGRAENLVSTGIRSRTVQTVAQSLYRLSYPTHDLWSWNTLIISEVMLRLYTMDPEYTKTVSSPKQPTSNFKHSVRLVFPMTHGIPHWGICEDGLYLQRWKRRIYLIHAHIVKFEYDKL